MCGIAGFLGFNGVPVDPRGPRIALEHLRHRGPDGEAVTERGPCTLVHTRLSVIDVDGGGQPMDAPRSARHGPLTVVHNGMIYNHRMLRRRLESLGHRFRSNHSDTEVLLHGYAQWGRRLPDHLNGMFALAIWDDDAQTLFLCRDRAGKKPLFFRLTDEQLVFASLVATILTAGPRDGCSAPSADRAALVGYLRRGYCEDDCLVNGIEQVPAGTWMTVDGSGRIARDRYWSVEEPTSGIDDGRRDDEGSRFRDRVRATLTRAVDRRLESDVPLGCFLSGGIDSSVIAALAQERLQANGAAPLRTFSVALGDADYDESADARLTATHLGTEHQQLTVDPMGDVIGDLERLVAMMGEPFADSSLLPTHWLSRAARPHVTVALTGDGGDELFGGYDRYRAMRWLDQHAWWLRRIPPGWVPPDTWRPRSRRTRIHRLLTAARLARPSDRYGNMVHLFSDTQISALGVDPGAAPPLPWPETPDPVAAARRWDLEHYLPHDLLRKVDRASMAVALEIRCPLLDPAIYHLSHGASTADLMPDGRPKGVLREIAADMVPQAVAHRPKRGFAIPIGRWFRRELREPAEAILLGGALAELGLDGDSVTKIHEEHVAGRVDHTHRMFALLMLALWWKRVTSRE